MANFFELVGEIAVEGAQASERAITAVDERGERLSTTLKSAGQATSRFGNSLSSVGDRATVASAAITAVGVGVGAYVNSVTQAAEETLQWSRRLDINVESMQVWQRVADRLGIQSDALIDGFKELSLRADEFAETGKGPAAEVFQRLGLSQDQVAAVKDDTEALFELVLSRIRGVQGAAARQRILDELFGGQAAEQFAELVGKSRDEIKGMKDEVRGLGGIFTEEEAERAREFNNAITDLGTRLSAVGQRAVLDLLPQFQALVGALEQNLVPAVQQAMDIFSTIIDVFASLPGPVQQAIGVLLPLAVAFGPILSIAGRLISVFGTLISGIGALTGVFSALSAGALAPLIPIILQVAAVAGALWLAWQAGKIIINWLLDNIPGIAAAIRDVIPSFDRIKAAFAGLWNSLKSILQSILGGFTVAWERVKQATIGRVMDMVDTVTGAVRKMWQTLTGGSIIPRLADEAIAEFDRMGTGGEEAGERMRRGLTDAMADVNLGDVSPGRGRDGAGSGQVLNVDMRHSTIRDDRDMTDRLRRAGADLSGAFA